MSTQISEPMRLDGPQKLLIDQAVARYAQHPGALLGILEDVQAADARRYLSMAALRYISERTGVPPSTVYSAATFYSLFNLDPQGDNVICVCRGTACHTRGSRALLERLKLQLGLQEVRDDSGSADKLTLTTPDRRFTIRTVACFGQCALAPVSEVNHAIRGHVKEQALMREVDKLKKDGAR